MTELAISLIRKSKLRLFMAVDFNNETILIFYPFVTMQVQSVTQCNIPLAPFSTNWQFKCNQL